MTDRESDVEGSRRLRVLISAFSCVPGLGSEPGTGWLWSTAAAVNHDVWLLTWDGYRSEVEVALAQQSGVTIRPLYVPQPSWLPGESDNLQELRFRYLAWQREAHHAAHRAHASIGFDLVHHLTLSSDWMPPGVAGIAGLPLVWGPVGGYSRAAWRMARWLGPRWVIDEVGRRATTGMFRLVCGRWGARRSSLVIAQNRDVALRLGRLGARQIEIEPNVALDPSPSPCADDRAERRELAAPPRQAGGRAVFAGRLVRWKGAALALRALADPRLSRWTLDIYGEGEDQPRLEHLRQRLNLGSRVRFLGFRERNEVRRAFGDADVLVLPSLNDSAGWVIAEAAAEGCPTVCLDRGGPPDLVEHGVGIAVPIGRQLPSRFATAMLDARRLPEPPQRWSSERLPAQLARWYQLAAGGSGTAGAGEETSR